jgi:pimeloyl-[acyl-carrier protein] methyl ester esterase
MFAPILGRLPGSVRAVPIDYPTDVVLDYCALEERLAALLPREPFALLGESFSGPLALRLAARGAPGLRAVVLVASFVRSPIAASRLWHRLAQAALFRAPPPGFVMRRWLLGEDARPALVGALREAIALVAPQVMAARVREVLRVDATEALLATQVPILYLAGCHDRLVLPQTAGTLRRLVPGMEVTVLDAPHLVLQCRPAEAAHVMARFLEK